MVKIRVKVGAAEAEVEAEPDQLQDAIDRIPEIIGKLPTLAPPRKEEGGTAPQSTRSEADHAPAQGALPLVTIEKSDSLADIIGKFFADPWGRERRKLLDVREALQSYGLNYPKQSVAVALLRLAKTTRIRRFKAEDGEFVYTASTPSIVLPSGPEPQEVLPVPEQN